MLSLMVLWIAVTGVTVLAVLALFVAPVALFLHYRGKQQAMQKEIALQKRRVAEIRRGLNAVSPYPLRPEQGTTTYVEQGTADLSAAEDQVIAMALLAQAAIAAQSYHNSH